MDNKPYKFYFLGESIFKNLKQELSQGLTEIKISTIGYMSDFNQDKKECNINFEKESIKINFGRIENNFKVNHSEIYYVYGILKVKLPFITGNSLKTII